MLREQVLNEGIRDSGYGFWGIDFWDLAENNTKVIKLHILTYKYPLFNGLTPIPIGAIKHLFPILLRFNWPLSFHLYLFFLLCHSIGIQAYLLEF
ncbi:hypothetical protein DDI74_16550 [Chryseobacterium gleum]|nr:hypothetical protein DDI74_16550 [Chryseobacterium gleum]